MSSYYWDDKLFSYKDFFEETRKAINDRIDCLSGKWLDYGLFRFGLNGHQAHSSEETAAHFSISDSRVRQLDSAVLRKMGIRMPTLSHMIRFNQTDKDE